MKGSYSVLHTYTRRSGWIIFQYFTKELLFKDGIGYSLSLIESTMPRPSSIIVILLTQRKDGCYPFRLLVSGMKRTIDIGPTFIFHEPCFEMKDLNLLAAGGLSK
jgi:hypothetical protein